MLHHILSHDFVIEFQRILRSQVVVDLTLLWLDDISLVRVSHVGEAVLIALREILGKVLLVFPGGLLLLHQPLGRGSVLALVVSVELAHHLVELVHVEVVLIGLLLEPRSLPQHSLAWRSRVLNVAVCQLGEFLLDGRDLGLVFGISEDVSFYMGILPRAAESYRVLIGNRGLIVACRELRRPLLSFRPGSPFVWRSGLVRRYSGVQSSLLYRAPLAWASF